MAKYTVKPGQNLFDVALHLYGSIEGLFDLLITNESLNMTSDLRAGQELEYHDDFVINPGVFQRIKELDLVPANSERHVYAKEPDEQLLFLCKFVEGTDYVSFKAGGEGTMIVDWGDNSQLQKIELSHKAETYDHYFDNEAENRKMKVYGNYKLTEFDTTDLQGAIYLVMPMTVDEYVNRANSFQLAALFLFEGTYKIDLQRCHITSLAPISDMSLQELDLRQVTFSDVSVLDDYLEYIANNYGTRRNCTVYLTTEPTDRGMAAIYKIIREPDWNLSGPWKFIINEHIYTP